MMNESPESVRDSEELNSTENELQAARLRFESLPAFSREAWIERARKVLPPSFHNDPDAVLFTALELTLNEKALKGSGARSSFKRLLPVMIICLFCSLPLSADAFWPFTKSGKKTPPAQEARRLSIRQSMYQSYYGDYVQEASADVYVMSADSPQASSFHRALKEIPIAINLGSDPETNRVKAATSNSPLFSIPTQTGEPREKKEEASIPTPKCLDTTVYFDLNSALVKEIEKKQLLEHINELKQGSVSLIGYTCDLGSQSYNDKLAMERAENVEAVLKENGVTPAVVKGEGRCCYISGDRAKNRRVEILCTKTQTK
jgi:outer membrane protein OmpA-like peptidoglycan-associated protein